MSPFIEIGLWEPRDPSRVTKMAAEWQDLPIRTLLVVNYMQLQSYE